ncbi:MAG: rsmE [Burkholderiaceae bacterium]|nr:rsmE [Burkholderiaceae bacterium]
MRSRFYAPAPWSKTDEFTLSPDTFHHAITVLRMRVGDVCDLFDGMGHCASAELTQIEKKSAQARWLSKPTLQIDNESPLNITLAQCLSSADKMDWTIEKAVELGVRHIVPVFSARSQVKLSPERIIKKMEHWQRIIIAASAQSERNVLPTLAQPTPLPQWLGTVKHLSDYKIVLHPDAALPTTLSTLPKPTSTQAIQILIGPESGLDAREVELALHANFKATLLGTRILRTETAGLATISALQALWGDF